MSNKITQITSMGGRVASYRKAKSLSQQELADIVGVSRGYIGDIERDRSDPSSNFLTLLTSKMDVSADWILTGEGEMLKENHANLVLIDTKRLTLAIETVEEGLEVAHRVMQPDKKAQLILAVYELFKSQAKSDKKSMLSLVQQIAA